MGSPNGLLLTPNLMKDFEVRYGSSDVEIESLRKIMLAMFVDTQVASIDRILLNEIAEPYAYRANDPGIFKQIIADYYLLRFVQRLSFIRNFEKVELIRGDDGSQVESRNFQFTFQPNRMSLQVHNKGDNNTWSAINSLIGVHQGRNHHIIIGDFRLGKTLDDLFVYRRIKAARQFLAASGIRYNTLSYLLCLPNDLVSDFMLYDRSRTDTPIGNYKLIRDYLTKPSADFLLVLSESSDSISKLAGELSSIVKFEYANQARESIGWGKFVAKHKVYFANLGSAARILTNGYNKIDNIHDGLVSLVESDSALSSVKSGKAVEYSAGNPELESLIQLSLLYCGRRKYELLLLDMAEKIYKLLRNSSPEDQLLCANLLFEAIPQPDISSFRNLTSSLYGAKIIPRRFIKDARGFLSYTLAELNEGRDEPIGFTRKTFEEAFSKYIGAITNPGILNQKH